MNQPRLAQPLRGIIPPLVTPLTAPDRVDRDGLQRLVEHLVAGGVAGLFVLGTTGEGPCLSAGAQREMIEWTCRQARGRVPVLVGITHASFAEAVDLAKVAADAGAEAVVSAGPCYFPASPADLRRYVRQLVDQIPLPLMLYNMPAYTKVTFDLETVRQLMEEPAVIGIKDSSADMLYFQRLIQLLPLRSDWTLLMGPEELTAEAVLQGAHGGVNGGANIAPSWYVNMVDAAAQGDWSTARELHRQVLRLSQGLYGLSGSRAALVQGIKCALAWLGICAEVLCEPFEPLGEAERQLVRERLEQLQLLPQRAHEKHPAPTLG